MKYINLKEQERLLCNKHAITKLYLMRKIKHINNEYVDYMLFKTKDFFDDINGVSLDINQRKVIINEDKNKLVIAGAGSGKTLTIVAYIKYLVEIKNINIDDILCISFTNETVTNLKKKLPYTVNVSTFHKLGLNILNNKYKIIDDDYLKYIIDEILCFINSDDFDSNIIQRFITLKKANDIKEYKNVSKKDINYLKIIDLIYRIYELDKNSQNLIDFDDMIKKAINVPHNKRYKYIIIDEFQDTSIVRLNLIKSLIDDDTNLMVVGDDFQSIYRFNGCDLNVFLNFTKYIKYTKVYLINNTYRNSQELIDIAGNFVMKNNKQIKKKLVSNIHFNKPIKICYYYDSKNVLKKLIGYINEGDILILGRNNFDINNYDTSILNERIKYLTIHRSKGLECDNVIILNVNDSVYGIPSKIVDNHILKYVITNNNYYLYDEERRLFYVALTRTKGYVYLLVNKNNPSVFIKELLKDYKNDIECINIF